MDSPTDPYNVDPDDDNVFLRFLDEYCPSPLNNPPVEPPLSPTFNFADNAPNAPPPSPDMFNHVTANAPIMFNDATNAQNGPPPSTLMFNGAAIEQNIPPPSPFDANAPNMFNIVAANAQIAPPPSPHMFNVAGIAQNVPPPSANTLNVDVNNINDFNFEFDIDVDDIINFVADHEDNEEGVEEPVMMDPPAVGAGPSGTTAPPAMEAGPSGTKELWFHLSPPDTLECRECTVAGELYDYSNGLYNIRMSVHAVAGKFNHLVFDAESSTDLEIGLGMETYCMNFEGQSLELINSSLAKYAIQIDENGAIILHESFIAVYNLILDKQVVVGHREAGSPSSQTSDSNEENTDVEEGTAMDESAENGPGESSGAASADNNDAVRRPPSRRPSVGIQRERTANMSISDFVPYFHLKSEDAAKMLNICPTTFKIQCRRLDIGRWPHRKIKSIDDRIRRLKKQIQDRAGERDMQAITGLHEEIRKEEDKKAQLYAHLTRPR